MSTIIPRAILSLTKVKPRIVNDVQRFSSVANKKAFKREEWMSAKEKKNDDEIIEIENPFKVKRKECILCKYKIEPDYKNVRLLSQFQSRHTGMVYPRNITGLCRAKQKKLESEMTKARTAGLMGFVTKNPEFVNDPKLFDPNHPIMPHAH